MFRSGGGRFADLRKGRGFRRGSIACEMADAP
jgi:hypothetical protein